jgi:hypothetical protein
MCGELRLLGAGAAVLVLATSLDAQTLPVPTLPPEPPPEAEPAAPPTTPQAGAPAQPEPVETTVRRRSWEYSVGAGIRYDSNIDFLIANGPSGVGLVPRGALAHVFWGPHGHFRAGASGSWTEYPEQSSFNRGDLEFRVDGSYRSSPGTTWRGNAAYGFGYSDTSQPLLEQGVLLQLVKTRTLSGAAGLAQQLGTQTLLRIDGRIYRTVFDAPGFTNGESVRGTVGLERRISSRNGGAIEYSFENVQSQTPGLYYLTHFVSLQWTRLFSLRTAFLLEGGVSYTPDAALAGLGQSQAFFGGATFRRQIKRSSLVAFVRREVVPLFGVGASNVAIRAGMNAVVPIGPVTELRLAYTHIEPEAPHGTQPQYPSSDDAVATLGRRLGGKLAISGEVGYRRRGATVALTPIEAFQAGVFLTLTPAGARTPPPTGR